MVERPEPPRHFICTTQQRSPSCGGNGRRHARRHLERGDRLLVCKPCRGWGYRRSAACQGGYGGVRLDRAAPMVYIVAPAKLWVVATRGCIADFPFKTHLEIWLTMPEKR